MDSFDFLNDKNLCFVKDREPCEIYLNGNKLNNLSAVERTLSTVDSLSYYSEYNNNLKHLSVKGNTMQKTGKNLIDVDKFVELVLPLNQFNALVERDGRRCLRFWNASMHGRDFTACCPTFKENTRYIFSFEAMPNVVFSPDEQHSGGLGMGFKPNGINPSKMLSAKTTTEFTRVYNINNSNTTVTDINISYGSATYWLVDLDTMYLYEYEGDTNPPYKPYTKVPMPDNPITIENASNISVELRGVNLFNRTDIIRKLTNAYYSNLSSNGFILQPNTTYTVSFDYEFISIDKPDSTTVWGIGRGTTDYLTDIKYAVSFPNFTKGRAKGTFTTPSNLGSNNVLFFRIPRNDNRVTCEVKLSNFMLNYGTEALPYEPYVEPQTVALPTALTLAENDVLTVDYTNKSVGVARNTKVIELTGSEPWIDNSYGGDYAYSLLLDLPSWEFSDLEKSYYCTHFSNVFQDKSPVFRIEEFSNVIYLNFYYVSQTSVEEWADWLRNQYSDGTPVKVQWSINEEYSLDTEENVTGAWVNDLLNLPTINGTNTITINGDINPTNTSITYAEWGGKYEN